MEAKVPTFSDDVVMDINNYYTTTNINTKGYASTLIGSSVKMNSLTFSNLYNYVSEVKKTRNIQFRFSNNSSTPKTFEVLGDMTLQRSIGGGDVIFGMVEGNPTDANRVQPIIKINGNLNVGDKND